MVLTYGSARSRLSCSATGQKYPGRMSDGVDATEDDSVQCAIPRRLTKYGLSAACNCGTCCKSA
eukprot:3266783-Rhodomonas_salina.1